MSPRITQRDRARARLNTVIYDHFWHDDTCPRFHRGGHEKKKCNCGRDALIGEINKAVPQRWHKYGWPDNGGFEPKA